MLPAGPRMQPCTQAYYPQNPRRTYTCGFCSRPVHSLEWQATNHGCMIVPPISNAVAAKAYHGKGYQFRNRQTP